MYESGTSQRDAHPNFVGDGTCNPKLNTTACNFDGGDCIGVEFESSYAPSSAPVPTHGI